MKVEGPGVKDLGVFGFRVEMALVGTPVIQVVENKIAASRLALGMSNRILNLETLNPGLKA